MTNSPMQRLKTGLVSVTFRKLTPARIAKLVAQAQLDGIEWGGDVHVPHGDISVAQEVRKLTIDHGLIAFAYGSYYRAGSARDRQAAKVPEWETVLDTADALGTDVVRVWAGTKSSQDASQSYRLDVAEDTHRIAEAASKRGIRIALEFHAGTLTDSSASTLELLAAARHPNVFCYWQPRNQVSMDECLADMRAIESRIIGAHVFHWRESDNARMPLAEGADRWAKYLSRLAAIQSVAYALMEFVANESEEQFFADAKVYKALLDQPE